MTLPLKKIQDEWNEKLKDISCFEIEDDADMPAHYHNLDLQSYLLKRDQAICEAIVGMIEIMKINEHLEEQEGEAKELLVTIFGEAKSPAYLIERRHGYNQALSDLSAAIKESIK